MVALFLVRGFAASREILSGSSPRLSTLSSFWVTVDKFLLSQLVRVPESLQRLPSLRFLRRDANAQTNPMLKQTGFGIVRIRVDRDETLLLRVVCILPKRHSNRRDQARRGLARFSARSPWQKVVVTRERSGLGEAVPLARTLSLPAIGHEKFALGLVAVFPTVVAERFRKHTSSLVVSAVDLGRGTDFESVVAAEPLANAVAGRTSVGEQVALRPDCGEMPQASKPEANLVESETVRVEVHDRIQPEETNHDFFRPQGSQVVRGNPLGA